MHFQNCNFSNCSFLCNGSELCELRDFTPQEIGMLHNECVLHVLNNYPLEMEKENSAENLITLLRISSEYLMRRYPNLKYSIKNTANSISKQIESMGNDENNSSMFYLTLYSTSSFRQSLSRLNISSYLNSQLLDLHTSIISNNRGFSYFEEKLSTIMESELDEIDRYTISSIWSIKEHSKILRDKYEFFTPKFSKQSPPGDLTCAEWALICDTLGGVVGTIFGGIGSIVTGNIFSLAVLRDCEDEPKKENE